MRDRSIPEKQIGNLQSHGGIGHYPWEHIIESYDRPRHRGNPRLVRLYRVLLDAIGLAIFAVGAYAVIR